MTNLFIKANKTLSAWCGAMSPSPSFWSSRKLIALNILDRSHFSYSHISCFSLLNFFKVAFMCIKSWTYILDVSLVIGCIQL